MVPVRDGVRLATDLYSPDPRGSRLPAILIRTPYGKGEAVSVAAARNFAAHGYAVAVQDTRGRFESEGRFGVMFDDAEDGYDTIDWLAAQDWSNGKVGTYGCSYRGAVQIYQARLRNPHLAAMIPQAAPGGGLGFAGGEPRYLGIRTGGAFELASTFSFMWRSGSKIHLKLPADIALETRAQVSAYFDPAPHLPSIDERELLGTLPVRDILKRAGGPPTDWEDVLTRDFHDPWWNQGGYVGDKDRPDVPTLSVNSWYDPNIAHTLYRFNLFRRNSLSETARDNQFVIISPMTHCQSELATANTTVGERDLGDARLGHEEIYLRWFDHWLKGEANGITGMPKVQYYLMGKNEWRSASAWPPAGMRTLKYYLSSHGRANSRFGDGALSSEPPGQSLATDRFVYDPATPVPSTIGPKGSPSGGPMSGPVDHRELEMRQDVLVYTSRPLTEDVEMTGPIEVVLYVSSSARDTDFSARLLDVDPNGPAFNLSEGILRARYREGYDRKLWMEPGKVYELQITLPPTSNYFTRGHQIRLEVSSSSFPRFDRNLNTGGNNYDETRWEIAANEIHHSPRFPSHVLLPIVRSE